MITALYVRYKHIMPGGFLTKSYGQDTGMLNNFYFKFIARFTGGKLVCSNYFSRSRWRLPLKKYRSRANIFGKIDSSLLLRDYSYQSDQGTFLVSSLEEFTKQLNKYVRIDCTHIVLGYNTLLNGRARRIQFMSGSFAIKKNTVKLDYNEVLGLNG